MKVLVTGASGLIGSRLVESLRGRGDEVVVLSRDPSRAPGEAVRWDSLEGPAPIPPGIDAVVHLAGEQVAQRWSKGAKERIRATREQGTANLVAGIAAAADRPRVLVSASAVGYYGAHGDEPVTEETPPGDDFLAQVCVAWEREAAKASELGVRVVSLRTGVVLDRGGGALAKMLVPFKLGVGGPVAGGRQQMPWVHIDDVVGMYLAAIDDERWSGPFNATAPDPVSNRTFSKALGRALHRPAVLPVPAFTLKAMYGDMAIIVTTGQRALPSRATELGYAFRQPDLDDALRDALSG